jgi:polyisoprenoid-binding protein YceI
MGAMTDTTSSPATLTLPLAPGRWTIDPQHSRVGFSIRHLGVAKVRGHFTEVDAALEIGPSLETSAVTATVALASIETGQPDRDAHVRSADFLDVERRPTMTFRSTRLHHDGDDVTLQGDLTIGEVTRPITLAGEFGGVAPFVDGTSRAGFEVTGELHRKEFGLGFGAAGALLGDVVKIDLDLEFVEPR